MEKITDYVYRLSLNLTNNPLKEIHSYLIINEGQALLIDTGFNDEQTKNTILNALKTLTIDFHNLKIFITHLHADHSGLAGFFYEKGCELYASASDAQILQRIADESFYDNIEARITLLDLDRYHLTKDILPKSLFSFNKDIEFTLLKENDILSVGNQKFKVIDIAGHTPGMIGLYDLQSKNFFAADHILDQISPNITYWNADFPALHVFLQNLEKTVPLAINTIFPAHRNSMSDHPRRALELIDHHHERLEEVLDIVTSSLLPLSASTTASRMSWNFRAPSWEAFPNAQKFFATNEAMAHLEYLYVEKKLLKTVQKKIAFYHLNE